MSKYQVLCIYGLRELLKANDLYSPAGQRMIVVNTVSFSMPGIALK